MDLRSIRYSRAYPKRLARATRSLVFFYFTPYAAAMLRIAFTPYAAHALRACFMPSTRVSLATLARRTFGAYHSPPFHLARRDRAHLPTLSPEAEVQLSCM